MRTVLLCAICGLAPMSAAAAPAGTLDPGFGDGLGPAAGVVTRGFDLGSGNGDYGSAMVEDALGRLYLAGPVFQSGGKRCLGAMRFSPDGIPDTDGFGTKGMVCHENAPGIGSLVLPFDATIDSQQRLLVAGAVQVSGDLHPFVCRLLPDGTLDTKFNALLTPGCVVALGVEVAVPNGLSTIGVVEAGGALYLSATVLTLGVPHPALLKFNVAGVPLAFGQKATLDLIAPGVGAQGEATDLIPTDDGGLLVTGSVRDLPEDTNDAFVARVSLASDALDPDFAGTGTLRLDPSMGDAEEGRALSNVSNGAVTIALRVGAGGADRVVLARVSTLTGAPDPAFGDSNTLAVEPCALPAECGLVPRAVHADDKAVVIVAQGHVGSYAGTVALRADASGVPDPLFGNGFPATTGLATLIEGDGAETRFDALLMQGDRIVLGGHIETSNAAFVDFGLARLLGDLSVDIFDDGFEDGAP